MKTKTLIMVCLILGIGMTRLSAQPNGAGNRISGTYTFVWDHVTPNNVCINETLSGQVIVNMSHFEGSDFWHMRTNVDLVGDVSGDHYTSNNNDSWHLITNPHETAWHEIFNIIIHRNGKPVSKWFMINHVTLNDATFDEKGFASNVYITYAECF